MNISMRQMRAFLHLARTGSFTRAAELAHMTQAGLSILVREAERQLGARLFERTTRTVQLTPAGKRLVPVVERALSELDGVAEEIDALGRAARQHLRITATPLVSTHLLPQLLRDFRDRHPGIRLTLLDASIHDVQTLVADGEADLGFGFFFPRTPGLMRKQVAKFPLMRVSPAPAPPEGIGRIAWASLRSARLIGLKPENPIQKAIDLQLNRLGIVYSEGRNISFFETLIAMVEAGFGSAIMPTFAVTACRRYNVRMDVLGAPKVELDFYRIARRGTAETEAMALFTEAMVQQIPKLSR